MDPDPMNTPVNPFAAHIRKDGSIDDADFATATEECGKTGVSPSAAWREAIAAWTAAPEDDDPAALHDVLTRLCNPWRDSTGTRWKEQVDAATATVAELSARLKMLADDLDDHASDVSASGAYRRSAEQDGQRCAALALILLHQLAAPPAADGPDDDADSQAGR